MALNNVKNNNGKVVHLAARNNVAVGLLWGLIKSPEELVVFALECIANNYRVMLHQGWVSYLFYTLLGGNRDTLKQILLPFTEEIRNYKADFDVNAAPEIKIFKDFDTIEENRVAITNSYAAIPDNAATYYEAKLRELFGATTDKDTGQLFNALKKQFISYAFQSAKPAIKRRLKLKILQPPIKFNQYLQLPIKIIPTQNLTCLSSF